MKNSKIIDFKCRAKCKNSGKWVFGYYAYKSIMNRHYIVMEEIVPYSVETVFTEIEVLPETVGMIRHSNAHGNYYDGDVYYHAGYGMETVSSICEIQFALAAGNDSDISTIAGNIYDTPDIINDLNSVPK